MTDDPIRAAAEQLLGQMFEHSDACICACGKYEQPDCRVFIIESALRAQREAGRQDMIEAATPEGVAANALLESVQRAIRGEEVSDFMLSFSLVREAKDAHDRIAELDERLSRSYPLRCRDCGVPYEQFGLDTVLPDEQWARLFPSGVEGQGGGGVLCASCIVKRAKQVARYGRAQGAHRRVITRGREYPMSDTPEVFRVVLIVAFFGLGAMGINMQVTGKDFSERVFGASVAFLFLFLAVLLVRNWR